jgi:hypothetical protein
LLQPQPRSPHVGARSSACSRVQTCDIWWGYDFKVGGWVQFKDGAAHDIKVRKNDNFRAGHQARVGVPKDKRYDLLAQTKEALLLLGTLPGPLCDGRFDRGVPRRHCPPLFPRRIKKGTELDLSRQATSPEISGMIISALEHRGLLRHLGPQGRAVHCHRGRRP